MGDPNFVTCTVMAKLYIVKESSDLSRDPATGPTNSHVASKNIGIGAT